MWEKDIQNYRERRAVRLGKKEHHDSVDAYRERRAERLMKRLNNDAGIGFIFGKAKSYGIDTKGMEVKDVFEAVAEYEKAHKSGDTEKTAKSSNAKANTGSKASGTKKYWPATKNEKALTGRDSKGKLYKGKNKFKGGYTVAKFGESERNDKKNGVTIKDNTDENGNWTPERLALHEEITDKFFDGKAKAEGKTKYTFMGGGPSSGKSYVVENRGESLGIPSSEKSVVLNPDTVKEYLPEYDPKSPSACHEESSSVNKAIKEIAMSNGYNVLDDGVADGSVKSMLKKIKQARDAGMDSVDAVYVTTDMDKAIAGNAKRERSVDENMLIEKHKAVSEIFPQIASEFDNCSLWYNSFEKGKPLVQIAKCTRGNKIEVLDQKLWNDFLAKKDYNASTKKTDGLEVTRMDDGKKVKKEGKKYYTKEELEYFREKCVPTPRQYDIIMAVQNEGVKDWHDLPFEPTDEEIEYFGSALRQYGDGKHIFKFIYD